MKTESLHQLRPNEWVIHRPDLEPDAQWFDHQYWLDQGRLLGANSGRGSAWMVKSPHGKWMLRHYFRGGLPARINRDKYLWRGLDKSRAVAEWRLLQRMHGEGLPVPQPVAARVRRKGWFYTADILMEFLPHEQTLARFVNTAQAAEDMHSWSRVGQAIARLHAAGYFHADLNAHNILLSKDKVWLIDFDRGRHMGSQPPRSAPAPEADPVVLGWQADNLRRLQRSLEKVINQPKAENQHSTGHSSEADAMIDRVGRLKTGWQALEKAYHQTLRQATG